MRKEYKKPEIKVNIFDTEDIMAESSLIQDELAQATIQGGAASWNAAWIPTKIKE